MFMQTANYIRAIDLNMIATLNQKLKELEDKPLKQQGPSYARLLLNRQRP